MNKDIYDLPIGWIWSVLDGVSLKITDGSHNPPDKKSEGIPMLSAQNITNNHISFENIRYISHEDFIYEYERTNIENGDVLLTIVGSIGRVAFVPETLKRKFAIQRSVALIKPSIFLDGKYLMYAMQAPFFQKELKDNAKGTAQKGVYLGILKYFSIPLPPLNEQYRIVEKIEELFSEIEHAEKNLSDIQKRLDICWQWELKFTYSSINEKIKLKDIADIIMGQSPVGSSYNNKGIGIPLINGPMEFGKSSFSKTTLSKWTTKPTKICNEGDIIICVRGSTTGRLNIAGFNACIGRGVAAIQPRDIYKDYLLYYLHYIKKDILEMGTGTTFPSISKEQLNEVMIPLCSCNMQMEFVNNFDSKYTIIENAKKEIEKIFKQIEVLKQTILYKAFTGELVPHNPEDEPAHKLLEKIKMERLEFLQNKPKDKKVKNNIRKMEHNKSVLELLQETQEPIPAKEIWQQSKHRENIDDFYAELKSISDLIEQTKSKTEILLSLKQ